MLIGQGRQLASPLIHRLLALRFHHHPQHGLGAAGANQDAAALSHAGFSGMHRVGEGRTVSPALATGPIGNGDVHQLLGIGLETAIHPAIQMDALAVAEGRELKCGEHSIAAEAMGGRKDVTGLFTTEGRAAGHHRRMDVLITHRRAIQASAPALPGPLEAEVGHHGGHEALIREGLTLLQNGSPEVEHVITVDHATTGINGQHPIGITIESKSHGGATLQHGLPQGFQLGGSTGHIDPLTVGLAMQHGQIGTQR